MGSIENGRAVRSTAYELYWIGELLTGSAYLAGGSPSAADFNAMPNVQMPARVPWSARLSPAFCRSSTSGLLVDGDIEGRRRYR